MLHKIKILDKVVLLPTIFWELSHTKMLYSRHWITTLFLLLIMTFMTFSCICNIICFTTYFLNVTAFIFPYDICFRDDILYLFSIFISYSLSFLPPCCWAVFLGSWIRRQSEPSCPRSSDSCSAASRKTFWAAAVAPVRYSSVELKSGLTCRRVGLHAENKNTRFKNNPAQLAG